MLLNLWMKSFLLLGIFIFFLPLNLLNNASFVVVYSVLCCKHISSRWNNMVKLREKGLNFVSQFWGFNFFYKFNTFRVYVKAAGDTCFDKMYVGDQIWCFQNAEKLPTVGCEECILVACSIWKIMFFKNCNVFSQMKCMMGYCDVIEAHGFDITFIF